MPRPIGPLGAASAAARLLPPRPALGNDDLLAVGEPGGAVDRFQHRPRGGAPGALHRVDDPGPGRHPVDAGARDRAGDVDDDVAAAALDAEVIAAAGRSRDPGLRGARSRPSARIARAPTSRRATATAP